MSGPSSLLHSLREIPTADKIRAEQTITLIDHTKPAAQAPSRDEQNTERNDSETPTAPPTPGPGPGAPLFKRLTNNSLTLQESVRQQITKQKYAKYGRDRYTESTEDGGDSSLRPPVDDSANAPQVGEAAAPAQTSYLERRRAQARALLKRRKRLGGGKDDQDTVIDILYENQRGTFLFGVPRYSSASLLPSDPKPWQNAQFRTSPVDIRNAQVPDPGWEWVWKTWYVDMSRDVDEEGWEYSLLFRKEFNWHGNHPWSHSFVRRRRWLRMRRRKAGEHKTKEKGHELTAEYFTIHPKTLKPSSDTISGQARTSDQARKAARLEDEKAVEDMEIFTIADLLFALRKSKVDREKLVAVRKFVSNGGDELYYLSQRMPDIMSLFIYQSSRRRLLSDLASHHDESHDRKEDLATHQHADADDDVQKRHETEVRRTEYLHDAIAAADREVKGLEYWSDIREMAADDQILDTSNLQSPGATGGHPEDSFANKQAASDGAPRLHAHAEHPTSPPPAAAPSKQSSRSTFFDAPATPAPSKASKELTSKSPDSSEDSGSSLGRYTTANESLSDNERPAPKAMSPAQTGKEKAAKLSSLDGMMDEAAEHGDEQDARKDGLNGDQEAERPSDNAQPADMGTVGENKAGGSGEDPEAPDVPTATDGAGIHPIDLEPAKPAEPPMSKETAEAEVQREMEEEGDVSPESVAGEAKVDGGGGKGEDR